MHVRMASDLLPRPRRRVLFLLYAPVKAVLQLLQLLWTLLVRLPQADVLLVQTPPAIPTLAAAWLVSLLRGTAVVVDWHNLGFSVLQHSLRPAHPFVRLSRVYEGAFGRALDGHLCVTAAMAQWLATTWGVRARVLHDRPPHFFRRLPAAERHALLRKLAPQFVDAAGRPLWPVEEEPASPWDDDATPWTGIDRAGQPKARRRRPKLLVSSTSWTADEDFGLLLAALASLDVALRAEAAAANELLVVAVITGKGPQKEMYREKLRGMPLAHVGVVTMWLEPEDYPKLLGAADLGVSLHTSTCGLDLPMKVPPPAAASSCAPPTRRVPRGRVCTPADGAPRLPSGPLSCLRRLPLPCRRRARCGAPGARHVWLLAPCLCRRLRMPPGARASRDQRPRLRHARGAVGAAALLARTHPGGGRRAGQADERGDRDRKGAAALGRELERGCRPSRAAARPHSGAAQARHLAQAAWRRARGRRCCLGGPSCDRVALRCWDAGWRASAIPLLYPTLSLFQQMNNVMIHPINPPRVNVTKDTRTRGGPLCVDLLRLMAAVEADFASSWVRRRLVRLRLNARTGYQSEFTARPSCSGCVTAQTTASADQLPEEFLQRKLRRARVATPASEVPNAAFAPWAATDLSSLFVKLPLADPGLGTAAPVLTHTQRGEMMARVAFAHKTQRIRERTGDLELRARKPAEEAEQAGVLREPARHTNHIDRPLPCDAGRSRSVSPLAAQ